MAYTNSKLAVYKKLSPNHSGKRKHSIDRISPHCVVGQCTAEGLGSWFARSSTEASSNYGIDKDGRVGLYVEEKNRSWCTSSAANDNRAVTIECASDTKEPYTMNSKVYNTLVKLCVDICKRYGKKKLLWFGDKTKSLNYEPKSDEMVITVHRWFANKSCPGNWLYSRLEKESINTMDAKGEVLLTIMASLAQQESQSMSQNVRMGIQYRFQKGKVQVNHSKFLGYTKDDDGNLIIVPEEAAVVKRIFREYLQGLSLQEICIGLEGDGILTGAHLPKWRPETVHKMLQNEKYMGDALLQKTYTVDFLTKKKVKNDGIAPQYYVENSHEGIIPRDLFIRTQEEIKRRANLNSGSDRKRRIYSSKYALSSIVVCEHCGDIFRRIKWNNRGCQSTVWRCVSRVLKKSSGIDCSARTVKEELLHQVVVDAINQILELDESFYTKYRRSLETALGVNSDMTVREIDDKLLKAQKELLAKSPHDKECEELRDRILALREEKRKAAVSIADSEDAVRKVDMLMEFVRNHPGKIEQYDDSLVRQLIEKIIVCDDRFKVIFKSKLEVEVIA